MAGLTDSERSQISEFLTQQGLTFAPLLAELSDHIACDIEERMNEGMSYDEAWAMAINELPKDHFKSIQQETMETINRRFNLSRAFTYLGLAALFLGTIFKTLHLQGTSLLAAISLLSLAAALITGSFLGIYLNRQRKGAINIIGIVAGTILMIAGYAFKIFLLPGADQIILAATIITLVFMLINTIYVYKNTDGLLLFLHEKHTPGIERFLLILLVPLTAYMIISWVAGLNNFFAPIILIVAIYSAALQLIALSWRNIGQNPVTLTLVIVTFVCMMVPMMAEMVVFEIRLIAVTFFSVFAAILVLRVEPSPGIAKYVVYAIPVIFILRALTKFNVIDFTWSVPVNVVVASVITAGIFLSPKHSMTRTLLVMSLASFLLDSTLRG